MNSRKFCKVPNVISFFIYERELSVSFILFKMSKNLYLRFFVLFSSRQKPVSKVKFGVANRTENKIQFSF